MARRKIIAIILITAAIFLQQCTKNTNGPETEKAGENDILVDAKAKAETQKQFL